jgi:adenylate kinase
MKPQTILFHGISGAGKGTQAQLLKHYLEDKSSQHPVVYLSTGQEFRHFMEGDNFAARKVKALLDEGGLLPDFLPVWIWTDFLNRHIHTGKEHIILDGAVRRINEAPMMESALDFFERENPVVVILNVSRERAIEHLKKRGRYDDNDEDIKARLDWYETNVAPALDYFRKNNRYRVFDVNGEQGIEQVHAELIERLEL